MSLEKDEDDSDFENFDLDLSYIRESENVASTSARNSSPLTTQNSSGLCHHTVDYDSLSTYIYPTNLEIRDYQYNIVQRAFYDNLLVALPTGLGKTFIASTVMLNFFRWFPQSKIIFMAPTRPLVAQQIKACCSITGIPSSSVAILLDKTRRNRGEIWNTKSVFFTTPQVVQNDLTTGLVDPKSVVLLVIDEAHRSRGNYAYKNVVQFIHRFNNSLRILALTATPASDVEGVQEVIDNLSISKVEVRTEQSIDISKYMKRKRIERVTVGSSLDIRECEELLADAISPVLKQANERKIYEITDPTKINAFLVLSAQKRLQADRNIPEGLKWSNYYILQLLNVVGQCLRRLNIYGVKAFYDYFSEKHREFVTKHNKKASKNKNAVMFYFHPSTMALLDKCRALSSENSGADHPKLEVLMGELAEFGKTCNEKGSRAIIFTEFRLSALDIVKAIEQFGSGLKPHIFIGQAKEKDKFDEGAYLTKGKTKKKCEPKSKNSESLVNTSELAQAKGMSQKVQKDIVKKFRVGDINVLVATSIGEEGLDIGEVDLIVCYDSTSSPIKNIQRMGRTGRKRDGKVLLLFAGNEEKKFDKAMGGYEYIQKHIMAGKLINLSSRNRIIPPSYKPIVERRFIEIPEENNELREEEDEDEIIRIATTYMTQAGTKKSSSRKKTNQKNPPKQFFMPDNVETGFRTAHQLVSPDTTSNNMKIHSSPGNDTLEKILQGNDESSTSEEDDLTTRKVVVKAPEYVPKTVKTGASLGVRKVSRQPTLNDMLALKNKSKNDLVKINDFEDENESFDDGLDHELLQIANRATPEQNSEELVPNIFAHTSGFLNDEEQLELYTSHHTSLAADERVLFYDPGVQDGPLSSNRMTSNHHYLRLSNLLRSMTNDDAQKLEVAYKTTGKNDYSLTNIIVPD